MHVLTSVEAMIRICESQDALIDQSISVEFGYEGTVN